MTRPPFTTSHKIILVAQITLAGLFAVGGLITAGGAEGWADLAMAAVAILSGTYLVGIALAAATAQRLLSHHLPRTIVLLVAPGLLVLVTILLLRGA